MSLALSLVASLALAASAERPRLVVLELSASSGIDATLTGPLTEALTDEVQRRGYFEVVSSRDLQALLGLERQRQLLGCNDEATQSCMAELSGALGARFVMNGTLARLGETFQLTLNTLDTTKAQPLGRATRLARSLDELRGVLPWAVAEATGTPLPAPPSRVLPYTLIGVGGATALFGVVWGALHLTQEQQLAATLDAGETTPGVLGPRSAYEVQLRNLETQRWIAVGALGAGLTALVVGFLLMPAEGQGPRVALVPTGTGLGLVGVFP